MPITHLATATNIIWKLMQNYGHDPEPLFRKAGINPDLVKQPEARILFINVSFHQHNILISSSSSSHRKRKIYG